MSRSPGSRRRQAQRPRQADRPQFASRQVKQLVERVADDLGAGQRLNAMQGAALLRFTCAVEAGIAPGPWDARCVSALWQDGKLTDDEVARLNKAVAASGQPFTDRDGFEPGEVELSALETQRRRH